MVVGYLYWSGERRFRPRLTAGRLWGLPLAVAALPPGRAERRLRQGAGVLRRKGVRRVLTPLGFDGWEVLRREGLAPVDPLPLCRAMAPRLALKLLAGIPLRERTVALRGDWAAQAASAACALCPKVGRLLLDFDRDGEALADTLRARYGAATMPLRGEARAQVSVEFAPRGGLVCPTLKLWGEPELAGLSILPEEGELPGWVEPLSALTLLWETERIPLEALTVELSGIGLDRTAENTYNTGCSQGSYLDYRGRKRLLSHD